MVSDWLVFVSFRLLAMSLEIKLVKMTRLEHVVDYGLFVVSKEEVSVEWLIFEQKAEPKLVVFPHRIKRNARHVHIEPFGPNFLAFTRYAFVLPASENVDVQYFFLNLGLELELYEADLVQTFDHQSRFFGRFS